MMSAQTMDRQERAGLHVRIGGDRPAPEQVADALNGFLAAERIPEQIGWRVRVAMDEIVANLIAHTPPSIPGGEPVFDLWINKESDAVQITIADDGPPFNPLLHPAPDVTSPLPVRKPGGLGIALVKSLMDDVHYERTDRNVLTIRKSLHSTSAQPSTGIDEHPTDGS